MADGRKDIHIPIKKDFPERWRKWKSGRENKKEGSLLLLFVAFCIVASVYFTLTKTDSPKKEEKEVKIGLNGSLFLACTENTVVGTGNIVFANGNSLLAESSPYFADVQVLGARGIERRENIIAYRVKKGDTLSSIADDFNISTDTIKWANSIKQREVREGDELLILPVTGVLYYVRRGDTPGQIAERHKADLKDIMSFNNIKSETEIRPGDQIIIPNGIKPPEPAPPQRISPGRSYAGFVPVTRGTVTQTVHAPGHANAVDIANACGTPIYATAAGTVERTGYDGMAGYFIVINHGSVRALYAHLGRGGVYVSPGQRVSAGQQIGLMGNTGYTLGATGCHLHFEAIGGRNPFSHLRRGDPM